MNDRLLSPPRVKQENAAAMWIDMIDTGEILLRAGFATRCGPDKVDELYREWNQRQLVEHDHRLTHLLAELSRRESAIAG